MTERGGMERPKYEKTSYNVYYFDSRTLGLNVYPGVCIRKMSVGRKTYPVVALAIQEVETKLLSMNENVFVSELK